ncbi:MAG: zinc ribbon domain-containing protein [Mycobacterium sp.]
MCPRCHDVVPAGSFCGHCGAEHDRPAEGLLTGVRARVYAVAPQEPVLLPMVTSTLFPHLPQAYRNPLRIGMFAMLAGVVAFSVLRMNGPLVVLSALGVPLLFVLYLWQSDLLRDLPRHALIVASLLGAVLGVMWVVGTGGLVARSYGIPMAVGFALQNVVGIGLVISVGGAIVMILPAVLVRMLLSPWESLDGFVIGALGALSFTGAATTARLAPQFVSGLIEVVHPARLFIEAVLYGVAVPLTAAAVGGVLGIVLWFRPGGRAGRHLGRVRVLLLGFTVAALIIYSAIWFIDSTRLPQWPQLGMHILMTVIALLTARVCIQLALLHEQPDPYDGQPLLCVHCGHVVPDMPFCPACGAAARASSRTSRRKRHESPPTRRDSTNGVDV